MSRFHLRAIPGSYATDLQFIDWRDLLLRFAAVGDLPGYEAREEKRGRRRRGKGGEEEGRENDILRSLNLWYQTISRFYFISKSTEWIIAAI